MGGGPADVCGVCVQDVIAISARPYGQRAVLKFAQYTGACTHAHTHVHTNVPSYRRSRRRGCVALPSDTPRHSVLGYPLTVTNHPPLVSSTSTSFMCVRPRVYTGTQSIAGRFTPGTFTNQKTKQFREPRLLVVTDPRTDSQVRACVRTHVHTHTYRCVWVHVGRRGPGYAGRLDYGCVCALCASAPRLAGRLATRWSHHRQTDGRSSRPCPWRVSRCVCVCVSTRPCARRRT
jgi:hypothetical protein